MSSNKGQDHHNKGESDRASGAGYNPPHSVTQGVMDSFLGTTAEQKQHVDDNKDYAKGWKNADNQSK